MSRRLFILITVAAATHLGAQTPKAYDPFEPPGKLVACHASKPPKGAPPGTLEYQFLYGTASFQEHMAKVIWDSAGTPFRLSLVSTENPDTAEESGYMFVMSLAKIDTTVPPDSSVGMKLISQANKGVPHENNLQRLTMIDVAAGRRLAEYLWKLPMRASCATSAGQSRARD